MKVAIIGAGLAGISCAHELERNGITPTIFHDRDVLGEYLELPVILLNMFNLPIYRPISFLKRKYNISVKPHYLLKEVTMVTPVKEHIISGELGYIFRRGTHSDTLLNQILKDVKTQVNFNTHVDAEDIRYKYDRVVVATAEYSLSKRLGIYNQSFNSYARIATITGNFRTDSATIWFDKDLAKDGFAYLVPDTDTAAKIVLIVSDADYTEFKKYWDVFYSRVLKNYNITDIKDVRHDLGVLSTVQYENLYFAGVAGGFIDSFLGFGSMKAILSGAAAGHCIAKGINYDEFMTEFKQDIIKKQELRKAYNTITNQGIEELVSTITKPVIKQLIYSNPLYRVGHTIPLVKMYNKAMRNGQLQKMGKNINKILKK